MTLTEAQTKAARAIGPVVIEGLPGSGRTTALVARFVQLLGRGVPPQRVLVLTANRDAAASLRWRLAVEAGRSLAEPTVATLTGLALAELRSGAEGAGPRLIGPAESRSLVARLVASDPDELWPGFEPGVRALPGFADAVAGMCREAGRRLLDPDELARALEGAGRAGWLPAAAFYRRYLDQLAAAGAVDSPGAGLAHLARAERSPPGQRYDAVLVDDAEAASPALTPLLRALDPEGAKIALAWCPSAAGPPSLWEARGWLASTRAQVVALDGTRRFTGPLAEAVESLAGGRLLEPGPAGGLEQMSGVEVHLCAHPHEEAEGLAALLAGEARAGTPVEAMAAIGRADSLDALERALTRLGMPAARVGGGSPATHWAVTPLLDALEMVAHPDRRADLFLRLAASPLGRLAPDDCAALSAQARREGRDPLSIARELHHPGWQALAALLDGLEPDQASDALCHRLWVRAPHLRDAREEVERGEQWAHRALDAATDLVEMAQGFVASRPAGQLDELLALVREDQGWGGFRSPMPAVALLRPDDVPGREYDVVAVVGATDSAYPGGRGGLGLFDLRVLDGGGPVEAARAEVALGRARLLRAVSRARRRLVITASVDPRGRARLSRFVSGESGATPLSPPRPCAGRARGLATDPARPRAERLGAAAFLSRSGADPRLWWGSREWSPGPVIPVGTLSYSAITAYERCPLAWLLEQKMALRPPDSHYAAHGSLVHELLDDLARGRLRPEDVHSELEARFDPARYPSGPVAEQFREEGHRALAGFLAWPEAGRFPVTGSEVPFEVEIAGVKVKGRIDRIERLAEGLIRLVDYKTGRKPGRGELDEVARQLRLYVLAARLAPELAVLGLPHSAALWYLTPHGTEQLKDELRPEDTEEVERMVAAVAAGIARGDFSPTPSYEACRRCDYTHLCPTKPEGRELLA